MPIDFTSFLCTSRTMPRFTDWVSAKGKWIIPFHHLLFCIYFRFTKIERMSILSDSKVLYSDNIKFVNWNRVLFLALSKWFTSNSLRQNIVDSQNFKNWKLLKAAKSTSKSEKMSISEIRVFYFWPKKSNILSFVVHFFSQIELKIRAMFLGIEVFLNISLNLEKLTGKGQSGCLNLPKISAISEKMSAV